MFVRNKQMFLLVSVLSCAIGVSAVSTANALAGNCNAWLQSEPAITYAIGKCDWLAPDTKARVTLDVGGGFDTHSDWFTQTGVEYRTSPWMYNPDNIFGGWPRSARVDLAPR